MSTAGPASSGTRARAEALDELLGTIRDELQSETRTKLLHTEELLDSYLKLVEQQIEGQLESTTKTLTERAANNEHVLREQMDSFKEEMKRNLSEHKHVIDGQLTDFLNKQNALVQNLSQQIDSYNRVSQAQSTDLALTTTKLSELLSAFTAHKATATNELATLGAGISQLSALLTEVQAVMRSQGESIAALDSAMQDASIRLKQTVDKLRESWFVGSKFK